MAFPTSLDDLDADNPSAGDNLGTGPHRTLHGDERTAIDALETKVGIDASAVTTSHDYKLSGVTGTDKAVSKTGTETLTGKTLTSPTLNTPIITTPTIRNFDGWQDANESWVYASATTITVPTNATTKYSVGDKIRFQNNDSGTYLYAYVVTVAATLLTVVGDAVPNATLTDNYYSKQTSPLGFPQWFSWTATLTASTDTVPTYTTTFTNRFRMVGKSVAVQSTWMNASGGTAGSGTTYGIQFNSPVPISANVKYVEGGSMVNGSTGKQIAVQFVDANTFQLYDWSVGGGTVKCAAQNNAGRYIILSFCYEAV